MKYLFFYSRKNNKNVKKRKKKNYRDKNKFEKIKLEN